MQFRQDIQALRGIAILLVVFYHSKLLPLSGGYLGVDVFFVISGFLITGQIHQKLKNDQFSFKEFYLRRLWRLLPAAYTVFAVCALLSPWLLSYPGIVDFREQLIGAISFTANFMLWQQTGYFESAAELKPLLHAWSLSIEEQYYIGMPILLAYLAMHWHFRLITLITLCSFGLYIHLSYSAPDAAFYLTPARVWSLGVGSMLALKMTNQPVRTSALPHISLLFIFIICCIQGLVPPTIQLLNTLLIVLATAHLINNPIKLLERGPIADVLSWFGNISYSLYLVHWPIFAFLKAAGSTGNLPTEIRGLALITSFILAMVLHRYVEQRFRITRTQHQRTFTPLIFISLILTGIAYSLPRFADHENLNHVFAPNQGLANGCQPKYGELPANCLTHPKAEMLLWGNSLAMHLVPALIADKSTRLAQSTLPECIPINGTGHFKPLRPNKAPKSAGKNCAKFNYDTLLLALNDPNIHTVVFASSWNYIFKPQSIITYQNSEYRAQKTNTVELKARFIGTLKKLRTAGKKIVVVSPPPRGTTNIAKCHIQASKPEVSEKNCLIDRAKQQYKNHAIKQFRQELEALDIPIYDFHDKLCDQQYCRTVIDGEILYRDSIHFSTKGSARYGDRFGLYRELIEMAR